MDTLAKTKKFAIGMVGLPGRGKTFLARKLCRYLNWQGVSCEVFNTSEYRRKLYGTKECTADFFDPENGEAVKAREECCQQALEDLIQFLKADGDVAILDGTNLTAERRQKIRETLEKDLETCNIIWIESIMTEEKVIDNVITRNVKTGNPDYEGIESDKAFQDFKTRIGNLSKRYEELSKELDGENTSFIKLYNFSQSVTMNCINGYLESKIVSYLTNLHMTARPIYFSRHGESEYNHEDRIGGDPDLTERGYAFAKKLNTFFQGEQKDGNITSKTKFFTSTLRRAMITSGHVKLGIKPLSLKILDEINAGICDGMTYKELDEKYPLDAKERKTDKLRYRYPRGESYLDLIHRVEPIIFEIERSRDPVIVVAHQAVIRCLYAYFSKHEFQDVPHISIPLHTVFKLEPETYFCHEHRYTINVETGDIAETKEPKPLYVEDYRRVAT